MTVDGISLEVFKHLFSSVAEEMGLALQRASFSPNIRERLDFSCAVFDEAGRMVAQAAHIPVHLGSMPASVEYALRHFDQLKAGDIVILNDPYHGGTHLPDITMVSPVFAGGDLLYFVASRAHHADVGGMSPGSLPLSVELYQEGLIIPPVKLCDAGEYNDALLALIIANSRGPKERLGDLQAQLAAQRVGERRLLGLLAAHGRERLREHENALLDYSRRPTEASIAAIPDGVYRFEDALEGDGQREFRIPIVVTLRVDGQRMLVDFSGSAGASSGKCGMRWRRLSVRRPGTPSARWRKRTWPVNHGCFLPVEVKDRSGQLLEPGLPGGGRCGKYGDRTTGHGRSARSVGAGTTAANTGRQSGDDEQFHGGWRVGQR